MKDQSENIKKKLIEAIRHDVLRREKAGATRAEVAEIATVSLPFMSNFMSSNMEGINGLAIPRLIRIASGLDLKIEITIHKKENTDGA